MSSTAINRRCVVRAVRDGTSILRAMANDAVAPWAAFLLGPYQRAGFDDLELAPHPMGYVARAVA